MVEDERYCIDLIAPNAAVRAAMARVDQEVLRDQIGHCVEDAIATGNKEEQRNKIAELMDVLERSSK